MKIQMEKSDNKFIVLILLLIGVVLFAIFQYYSTSDLKREIKEKLVEVENTKKINKDLLKSVELLTVKKDSLLKVSDSIEKQETYYKNRYYATNKELKKLIDDYNNLDNDGKWDAFSESLDN